MDTVKETRYSHVWHIIAERRSSCLVTVCGRVLRGGKLVEGSGGASCRTCLANV